jgi:alpha-aminoadipic semialdehyde synthase
VKQLVEQGIEIYVQPSEIRIFKDEEYRTVGAKMLENLSTCDIVLGVKEFPISFFKEGQGYMFFSHVIKGQSYNMPMLQKLLDLGCTLMDYEKVTDDDDCRLIFFGNYAGLAGTIECLYTLGKRLEWEGITTPFLKLKRPMDYEGLEEAKKALEAVGHSIESDGLPDSVSPLVVGFAGYGNVSKGGQEILNLLPHEDVAPSELASLIGKGKHSRHKVYKVVFYEEDMVVPLDPAGQFELQDYFQYPEKYKGVFDQYLNHLTILINCIYWTEDYPRLLTKDWLKHNWRGDSKLKVLGDISCDIEGSIECTLKSTDPGNPIYVYLPDEDDIVDGWKGEGPVVMAVDTLPCELPRESSTYFGNLLMPFVGRIALVDFQAEFEVLDIPPEIKRCIIILRGNLTPDFEYLIEYL